MRQLALVAALVSAAAAAAAAQPATAEAAPDSTPGVGIRVSFRPSVAIVVGIFTMIFSLTFILLMYAKFCHPSNPANPTTASGGPGTAAIISNEAAGGVPKPAIEALPFFRFATLRGSRHGMECSVCLARFDDADLLRLLPRCRHAFHLGCVDRWLESNATCPLCRTRVDAGDAALGLKYPSSARIVFGGDAAPPVSSSSGRYDDDTAATGAAGSGRDLLDIFVERVPGTDMPDRELDRHKHRIIVSDAVLKMSRWSDLNSAALLALDTEMMMLRSTSSARFFPDPEQLPLPGPAPDQTTTRGQTERKRLLGATDSGSVSSSASAAARMISSGVRSMSEIVSLPRLRAAARERLSEDQDNRYQRWLPIARRTARWFAGGQSRGEEEQGRPGASAEAVHDHVGAAAARV